MENFLKRIYPYFPVSLQNLGISLYGYYWKRERFGREFDRTVREFRERDHWPEDRMRDYLVSTLRTVVRKAFDAPYYRESWAAAGIRESHLKEMTLDTLHRLPVLPKQHVRRAPLAFVLDRRLRSGRLRSYLTSGSTNTPIRVFCTRTSHQRFVAAREVRSFGWAGTSVQSPRAMVGGRIVVPRGVAKPPFYRYNAAEKQVYFSAFHIAPAHIADYVEGMNRYRPQVLTGYASSLSFIAHMMRQQGISFDYKPVAAITSSEGLTDAMKRTFQESWDCRAYEEYGSIENCGLATECEEGRLHVNPDFGIIEIVDQDDCPVPSGIEGRIVCTGLLNDAQLLVRYDLGDTGLWSKEKCPCGRDHLPVLQEVTGRVEDVVVGPDGRRMTHFLGIFVGLPYVIEGQVVQDEIDRFVVRVVTEDGFGDEQVREIRHRFEQRLGPVKVTVRRVRELERGANGKLRAVISHVC